MQSSDTDARCIQHLRLCVSNPVLRMPAMPYVCTTCAGHNITTFPWGACVSAIVADPDDPSQLTGICDPRKDGAPAVY
jgi:hypothetical protein